MAAKKRTKKQRERDLATVASYYCQGLYQYQIAEKMGLSQSQICYDLKVLHKRWMESSVSDFNQRKAEELAKIDNVEKEAWVAWTTSKASQTPAGDPRFLQNVQWCIQKRCKILGLDAIEKLMLSSHDLEVTGQAIGEIVLSFVPSNLQELCRQQLEAVLAGVPVTDSTTVH